MPDAVCAAPLCDNSIADLLEAYEAKKGRKGRPPIYCSAECRRVAHTRDSRKSRRPKRRGWWHRRTPVIEEGEEGFIHIRGPSDKDANAADLLAGKPRGEDFDPGWDSGDGPDKGQWDSVPGQPRVRFGLLRERTWARAASLCRGAAVAEAAGDHEAAGEILKTAGSALRLYAAIDEHFDPQPSYEKLLRWSKATTEE